MGAWAGGCLMKRGVQLVLEFQIVMLLTTGVGRPSRELEPVGIPSCFTTPGAYSGAVQGHSLAPLSLAD